MTVDSWAIALFWIGTIGVLYPYAGYPMALLLLRPVIGRGAAEKSGELPTVSMIIPVYNEAARLEQKIANTAALNYPADRLQVLFVSDGSTDATAQIIRNCAAPGMTLIELPGRGGKAAALNAGLARATGDMVIFTDASILLESASLRAIVGALADPSVGCVSGEDRILDGGGEGLYGRYELMLRRLESELHSIVGASGCFYAQRRQLCEPFTEGMAPDFLSVLRTVERGYRALTEPSATGAMVSVRDPRHEFDRKVRTLLRGMTALFAHRRLLNPFRDGVFAFELWSHKVLRWTVPFGLLLMLLAPLAVIDRPFYLIAFVAQVAFYAGAGAAYAGWADLQRYFAGRVALYFSSVNAAIIVAWYQYFRGVRQELWTPSQREQIHP